MLSRFLVLKDALQKNKFNINLEKTSFNQITRMEWKKLRRIQSSLKPARIATFEFQNNWLTLNDFFVIWARCYQETSGIS